MTTVAGTDIQGNTSPTHSALHTQSAQKDEVGTFTAAQTFRSNSGGGNPLTVSVNTGHADGLRTRFSIENNSSQAIVDMNIRGAVLNVGNTDSTSSAAGTQAAFYSPTGDSSTPIAIYDPGSTTVARLELSRLGAILSRAYGAASQIFQLYASGEANARFAISDGNGGGQLNWGPGGGTALDTNLYRSAANELKTDDKFLAALGLGTEHVAAATPTGGTSGEIKVGTSKIWVNDAGTWKSVAVA